MTYKNQNLNREHNRLSQQIKRARAKGQDISLLVAQREALMVRPQKKGLTGAPKISNRTSNEILTKIEQLSQQQKNFYEQLTSGKVNY